MKTMKKLLPLLGLIVVLNVNAQIPQGEIAAVLTNANAVLLQEY